MALTSEANQPMRHLDTVTEPATDHPNSYIAALKHFSERARCNAPLDRKIEWLRSRSDVELERMGILRSEIERLVYAQAAS